ncbi:hypothetical protein BH20ACT19_BH20ACT19_12090 [soil metagenome]
MSSEKVSMPVTGLIVPGGPLSQKVLPVAATRPLTSAASTRVVSGRLAGTRPATCSGSSSERVSTSESQSDPRSSTRTGPRLIGPAAARGRPTSRAWGPMRCSDAYGSPKRRRLSAPV